MCGIVGIVDIRGENRIDEDILSAMALAIAHRGPEKIAFFRHPNVGFGFVRLSIIDLENGMQPMFNEEHTITSICNGEVYDYLEIRHELLNKGHKFRTQSDCELIPHLYEEYGEAMLNQMEGQFAFALFDERRSRLFAARDGFGIAPFFYTISDGLFIFGSEIKAILAHPYVKREVDMIGLDQIFSFPGLISPRTMFRNIYSLPAGHYLTVDIGNLPKTVSYWDLSYPKAGEVNIEADEHCIAERLNELMLRSVRRRLLANVPVGLYLSGGLDSSYIAALARHIEPMTKRHSFSIDFPERELSEFKYQRLMSRHISSVHHSRLWDRSDIASNLQRIIYHCECPLKETYNTAAIALSESVRENGLKVVLTGQGADELFGGYIGYRFDQFRSVGKNRLGSASPEEAAMREHLWGDSEFFYEKDQVAFQTVKHSLYSNRVKEAYDTYNCLEHFVVNKKRLQELAPLHRRSYIDFKLRLCDHLLGDHGDRMTFANSIEARHPFLDREVVDFIRQIPPELKLRQYDEKYILKLAASKLIPNAIIRREKTGFASPGSPCLLVQNIEYIDELLSTERIRRDGYFNPQTIEQLKKEYSCPGFRINVPFETDLLAVVITFGIFLDTFDLPRLG
ncbi:MAG: asparagine synthase (glutamine-hydrolyzing) [Pleurocapsa sp. CRU_1_2]|nr:asparagine synthase (glutamine-hydrolyzing) [Pleurocapsa sp. CRU_1_2]